MSLTIDELTFELRRTKDRKTVQITVDRGGELILTAPERCPVRTMEDFVREKRFWIYTKLAEKEAFRAAVPKKQLVTGEGFPYLGRSYRLLIVKSQAEPLKLEHGRFKLRKADVAHGREHLIAWYVEHATPWLETRVERFARRVGAQPTSVTAQDLGYRWGSCGKGGKLFFHWRSILLPPRIVEYIVVHELVHLLEPHHTPAFWTRVERAMPDCAQRKQWLAEHAAFALGV
ncbi:MAG: M48 family metallopeptidase [Sandaracinaceae bacterium]|nr:M48 family metallopeptidase [Sandaracinaceae bacterium]